MHLEGCPATVRLRGQARPPVFRRELPLAPARLATLSPTADTKIGIPMGIEPFPPFGASVHRSASPVAEARSRRLRLP